MKHSLNIWHLALPMLLVVLQFPAFARSPDSNLTPAMPTESQDRTYRTIGGRSIIAIISSDELELRQGGDNIVCKYTEKDGKLRVIVNMLGTTTAKYFNLTPQGLVDEGGEVFYEPETFQKITAQIQLNTELVEAVERDDAAGIDALVAKGAPVESHDNRGTALMLAINGGLTNAAASLLKNGANPNQMAEGDGMTPLMAAAGWQGGWKGIPRKPEHDTIVSMLCGAKADLNAIDKDGNTALMLSLIHGNLEATKILVAAGADRTIKNGDGRDAFGLAQDDDDKIDALRTTDEQEVRRMMSERYSKLIVGVWRDENSVVTYNADGTKSTKFDSGEADRCNWSITGDILTFGSRRGKIIELTDTIWILEVNGQRWRAARVSQEEIEAAHAKVVATVNGACITEGDIQKMMNQFMKKMGDRIPSDQMGTTIPRIRERILEELIMRHVMLGEVARQGIILSDEEYNTMKDKLVQELPPGTTFESYMAETGTTGAEVREQMAVRKMIVNKGETIAKPTDDEIRKHYDENKSAYIYYDESEGGFNQDKTVSVSHILIKVDPTDDDSVKAAKRERIDGLQTQLLNGADFAQIAKANSDCPSAANGGALAAFGRGTMVPEFESAAFSQPVQAVGNVIETQFGYHLIKVTGRGTAKTQKFSDVKARISDILYSQNQQEAVREYTASIRAQADIQRFDQTPESSISK